MKKRKYKSCSCGRICGVGFCEITEAGGCYCVCLLKNRESSILDIIKGKSVFINGGILYDPNRTPTPLKGKAKEEMEKKIEPSKK